MSPVGTTSEAGQSISYQTGLLHTLCLGTFVVCLPLQYLLQSCSRLGRGIAEDMCYDALLLHLCNQITRGCFVALEINHFNCACEMMTFFGSHRIICPFLRRHCPLIIWPCEPGSECVCHAPHGLCKFNTGKCDNYIIALILGLTWAHQWERVDDVYAWGAPKTPATKSPCPEVVPKFIAP